MDYKVTFENRNLVQIELNDVYFSIIKDTGTLYNLKNVGAPTDIVIPHTFPSGHQIQYLNTSVIDGEVWGENMVEGVFNELVISDNIIVGGSAFHEAEIKKVVWNDCSCIPSYCFQDSNVEEITNIANVETVMEYAFSGCDLKNIIWPEHCYTIPKGCFRGCRHLSKFAAPYVREIEANAFSFSNISSFDWPAGCSKIPEFCFTDSMLTEINNIDGVTAIERSAFADTDIITLDLSGANISYIAPGALAGLPDECNLILPYYFNREDLADAIKHG